MVCKPSVSMAMGYILPRLCMDLCLGCIWLITGFLAAESYQWVPGNGIRPMGSWLRNPTNGFLAAESNQWIPGNRIR